MATQLQEEGEIQTIERGVWRLPPLPDAMEGEQEAASGMADLPL